MRARSAAPLAAWHRLGCLLRASGHHSATRPRLSLGLCTPAALPTAPASCQAARCQVLVCLLRAPPTGWGACGCCMSFGGLWIGLIFGCWLLVAPPPTPLPTHRTLTHTVGHSVAHTSKQGRRGVCKGAGRGRGKPRASRQALVLASDVRSGVPGALCRMHIAHAVPTGCNFCTAWFQSPD
jgi:hypothetical protein